MNTATEALVAALQDSQLVGGSPYLEFLRKAAARVDCGVLAKVHGLAEDVDALVAVAKANSVALTAPALNEFAQRLGEAHFKTLCAESGFTLSRVPAGRHGVQTPDFTFDTRAGPLYFEVKTLSVVDGEVGLAAANEEAFRGAHDLERQRVDERRTLSTHVSTISPYRDCRTLKDALQKLLRKVRGNIHAGQFANPNTFLVVDLSMLPAPHGNCPAELLRPVFWDPVRNAPGSGALWTVAFGAPAAPVFVPPEFEGKPGIEGELGETGILIDPQFSHVRGILFVVHPLGSSAWIGGLFRSADHQTWNYTSPAEHPCEILLTMIADHFWNDDVDSMAFCLPSVPPP